MKSENFVLLQDSTLIAIFRDLLPPAHSPTRVYWITKLLVGNVGKTIRSIYARTAVGGRVNPKNIFGNIHILRTHKIWIF